MPFGQLVEALIKTHSQLAHVGRTKLIDVVLKHFWHPEVGKVAGDICRTCVHCQLFKVSAQQARPPVLKVQANSPYDLVAMDLVQFPRSRGGHVAILVAVDHYSKFLCAVPLRDKTAPCVVDAFNNRVLPSFLKIPNRFLTDNGPEFRSSHFEDAHGVIQYFSYIFHQI